MFPLPDSAGSPDQFAIGPDGNLWYASIYSDVIGRITPDGNVTVFPVDPPGKYTVPQQLRGLTAGPDGNLWFTEFTTKEVGRITPSGDVTLYPVSSQPELITAGPDGNLWYLHGDRSGLGRITPSGQVTEFPIDLGTPTAITVGPDGAFWIADALGMIDRVTTDGVVTRYAIPFANAMPESIVAARDGNIWFTDLSNGAIGEFVPTQAPIATGSTLTATPGQPFSGTVATITALDPHSSASDFSATIDWGNGTTSAGTIVAERTGVYDVNGSASYCAKRHLRDSRFHHNELIPRALRHQHGKRRSSPTAPAEPGQPAGRDRDISATHRETASCDSSAIPSQGGPHPSPAAA
jgi:streptogramin lyase